jgi:hypothetical protein
MDLRTRIYDLRSGYKPSRLGYFLNQKSLILVRNSKELKVLEFK